MLKQKMTLCIVCKENRLLLGMKKRGFGKGRWNGFGGKVKEGEAILDSAKRELHEEAGIIPIDIEMAGLLEFEFEDETGFLEVHLFRVQSFIGDPSESDEMSPFWFSEDEIPFGEMWADDKFWMPLFLQGKFFRGYFKFKNTDVLKEYSIKEVSKDSIL